MNFNNFIVLVLIGNIHVKKNSILFRVIKEEEDQYYIIYRVYQMRGVFMIRDEGID